ncbi:MAG TPA: PKD domain-containing protein, partial [Solirubrobacteraceae bacterium]
GDEDGDARIDIGASEYRRRAPSVTLDGPSGGVAGQALTFTATGTDPDPGDDVALTWRVDGAAAGDGGGSLEHVFAAAGPHVVEVVATDPAGAAATASRTVTIDPAPAPGGGAPPPSGGGPPVVVVPPGAQRAVVTLPRRATLRRGRIRVTLACAGAPCAGTLTLRAARTRIGRKRFALAAGRRGTIAVRVKRRKVRRVKRVSAVVRLGGEAPVAGRLRLRRR